MSAAKAARGLPDTLRQDIGRRSRLAQGPD